MADVYRGLAIQALNCTVKCLHIPVLGVINVDIEGRLPAIAESSMDL